MVDERANGLAERLYVPLLSVKDVLQPKRCIAVARLQYIMPSFQFHPKNKEKAPDPL